MEAIIVGVEESDGAAAALRWAKEEAELHGARLTAVLCWGFLDQHRGPGVAAEFDPAYTEADAAAALDAIVVAAVGRERSMSIGRRTVIDLPANGLLAVAADADLLAVGARGLNRFREAALGSVSQRCVSHATIPVAIVRLPAQSGSRRRVVVGIDGSEPSRRALIWAVVEGRRRRAIVEAVHAWHMPVAGSLYVPVEDPAAVRARQAAADLIANMVASVDTEGLPEPVVQTAANGSGGWALVDAAAGADLVVVGSRGLGGFKGLLLGSVSYQVTHHAPCPVVVIPHVD